MGKQFIIENYKSLIELRNRLNGADITIYEEDHLTLDHTLDLLEKLLKGE